jgi:hypothetical protein
MKDERRRATEGIRFGRFSFIPHPSSFIPYLNMTPYFIAMSLASLVALAIGHEARICVAIWRI